MIIVGIESSCDETGVGIIEFDPKIGVDSAIVLADVVASSVDEHIRFGGVVPEIASRAHVEAITPTMNQALEIAGIKQADAICVTAGPGLVGCLMVGVGAAKAYARAWDVPLYGLNHLAGHIAVDTLEHGDVSNAIGLLVSGGHTSILKVNSVLDIESVGSTIDDAAGEAFDKVARLLGLGYPGGPIIDKLAQDGDKYAFDFPRPLTGSNQGNHLYNFSFSGLKTAVARVVNGFKERGEPIPHADIAASFQEAVADVLITKTMAAVKHFGANSVILGGGASANSRIRSLAKEKCDELGVELRVPKPSRCTDNGVMIASLGLHYISAGKKASSFNLGVSSRLNPRTISVVV